MWRSDGTYTGHSHCRSSFEYSISASSDDVAALTEEEYHILDAIHSHFDRYTVYSTPGKLAWGVGLKVGDTVLARLPLKGERGFGGGQQDLYTAAIIRWYSDVKLEYVTKKYMFGVEITVSIHCH